jgi:hypothetical protein
LQRVAQREGEGENVVLQRGEEGDLVDLADGIAVLIGEAIVIDGAGYQENAANLEAPQAPDGLQDDASSQRMGGKERLTAPVKLVLRKAENRSPEAIASCPSTM